MSRHCFDSSFILSSAEKWEGYAVESQVFSANDRLNLSIPLLTVGRGTLINVSIQGAEGVQQINLDSVLPVGCVARISGILSVMSQTSGQQYILVFLMLMSFRFYILQQNYQKSEYEAQSLAFPIAFCFQRYSQSLHCCVRCERLSRSSDRDPDPENLFSRCTLGCWGLLLVDPSTAVWAQGLMRNSAQMVVHAI